MTRMLTGDRPTGRLHLGHLTGSLRSRVRLQQEGVETFILVADLHVLTTKHAPQDIQKLTALCREQVADYLACGIDPQKATIYLQSAIPEVPALAGLLANLTPVSRLQRLPSLKEMASHIGQSEGMSAGLLSYPVLQAADILLARADVVPVGADNVPHVELTRELVRRFNHLYGPVLTEPEALVSGSGALVGIHNRTKMSKSAGNAIFLSDDPATVRRKVRKMYTDPARIHADIPGTVEGNPVFAYHDLFNPNPDEVAALKARYRAGTVGDGEVKARLVDALEHTLAPIRARRAALDETPGLVDELLLDGTARMQAIARETMRDVRRAMGLTTFTRLRRAVERRRARG